MDYVIPGQTDDAVNDYPGLYALDRMLTIHLTCLSNAAFI